MRMMSIKLDDWFFDQGKEYAKYSHSSFAGLCRGMLYNSFFERLKFDISHLEMIKRMLEDPEKYQLTTKEIAYWEMQAESMTACVEKFSGFFGDLAAYLNQENSTEETKNA